MATISEALAIAFQHHQSGHFHAAEQVCRQILAVEPRQAETLHLLGVIAHQVGRHDLAVEYIRQSIGQKGTEAAFHNNLGNVFKDQGKADEAIACYRRALDLKPDLAAAHNNLGVALKDQGQLEEAVACYRRATELKPDYAEAHNNLANALKDQGMPDQAVAGWRRALELNPQLAEAHNNLGVALKDQGNARDALACYRRALQLKPDYVEVHNNLGNVLRDRGQFDEALACYRRALQLKPDYVEAQTNLGNVFRDRGQLDDAVACYRRALELKPDYAQAHSNLGNALKAQGNLPEALACYLRAIELKPDCAEAHSNLLFALQNQTGVTPAQLAEAHAEYDLRHAAPLRAVFPPENARKHEGRLRLGFLSPDFRQHPVAYLALRAFENLDAERCETFCYYNEAIRDAFTNRFQAAASHWRDVLGMSDQGLAEQIRADRIDILYDLAGHSGGNRLLVLARKPAPIQVSWVGYPGSSGLRAVDYMMADRYEVPPGAERHYPERLLRMPDGYVCYDPPDYAPAVTPLPASDRKQVTFACFNNTAKVTPEAVEVWARILRRLPGSRLVLKYKGWNDSGIAWRFAARFAAHGVAADRLEFLGSSPHAELLAEYQRMDLALDTFPYSGGLTTCEALWMGVPVVTFPGETFAGRHSLSHLSNVGLTETIARDLDNYVELAVSLADDLPRLALLRAGLRDGMAASPLCDGKRFADHLLSMLQRVWEERTRTG